jgi:hypothetical protein
VGFDPLSAAFDLGGKILERIFPDPVQRDAAKLKLLEMQQTGELAQLAADTDLAKGQLAINQIEAASPKLFVSGWRPFIGWTCGTAFAYGFVIQPFATFIILACGYTFTPPEINFSDMLPVLLGMLGMGGLRTAEKIKGVTK